jgi:hypothetical protein
MKILESLTYEDITVVSGQSIDIGNNASMQVQEIFEIDGCNYFAIAIPSQNINANIVDENTKEVVKSFPINRSFAPAEYFIEKNRSLLS